MSTPVQNYVPARNGRVAAICCCCGQRSRPVDPNEQGEPDLWKMARGWSTAPYPADCKHDDGSVGSTFHCPSCNRRLHKGETLQRRSYLANVAAAVTLAALCACGGGGGGGGGGFAVAPATPTAVQEPAAAAPTVPAVEALKLNPVNPGCVSAPDTHVECPLIASGELIGVGVPAGTYVRFTNRTGAHLQIDSAQATTGETQLWSEWCAYVGELVTGQPSPGRGEIGCSSKQPGENYPAIRWGDGTGLSIAPGEVVYLNSHTEPGYKNHTYALSVRVQTTGLHSWRQPQQDAVIYCDGQQQSTAPTPWRNDTGRELHLSGASLYSEDGRGSNTLSGPACVYVMDASGATKYQNCDGALRSRGEVSFPVVTVAPGEYVSAQGVNACPAGAVWDWAAFLRVW